MQKVFTGIVDRGFQYASGQAVGREEAPSPFPHGTVRMQHEIFREHGIDLEMLVPDLFWGTVNVLLGEKLKLERPDYTARAVDWTKDLEGKARIAPETFSFTRCCLAYPSPNQDGAWSYYPGLIYYPHPETKPGTNAHNFNALEILTSEVPNLVYGTTASVICRADAFVPF